MPDEKIVNYCGKLTGKVDLFLVTDSGVLLKYYQIGSDPTFIGKNHDITYRDYFASFITAQMQFYESIGLSSPLSYSDSARIKIDENKAVNIERRLYKGKRINGILFMDDLNYLDPKGHDKIDELNKTVVNEIDSKYESKLTELNEKGFARFEAIRRENEAGLECLIIEGEDVLDFFVKKEIVLMKEQMFTSYLQAILADAINYNVKRETCTEFMQSFGRVYDFSDIQEINGLNNTIRDELALYYDIHPTMKKIIQKHNDNQSSIWKLYNVPLIKKED